MRHKLNIKNYLKRYRRTFIVVGVALFVYIFIFSGYGLIKIFALKENIRDTERQITILSAKREALISDKHNLESDKVHLEKVIRKTFGMIKEGERCTIKIK